MTTLYIAGPMTGVPDWNFPAFRAAAIALRAAGYTVISPIEVNPDTSQSWKACLRRDIAELVKCDGVAVLPGHGNSRGACLEVHIAHALEMDVHPVRGWLNIAAERAYAAGLAQIGRERDRIAENYNEGVAS